VGGKTTFLEMRRKKLTSGFLGTLLFSLVHTLHLTSDWLLLSVSGLRGQIRQSGDLLTIMDLAQSCRYQIQQQVDLSPLEVYVESCGSFLYGTPLYMILGTFSINSSSFVGFGVATGYFFSALVGFLIFSFLENQSSTRRLLATVAFFSPGALLLFERANLDLFILILVLLGAIFASRGRFLFSTVFLALTAVLKFYTLPLVALMFLRIQAKGVAVISGLFFIGLVGLVVFDILRIPNFYQVGTNQFGAGVWSFYAQYMGLHLPPFLGVAIGTVLPLIGAVFLWRIRDDSIGKRLVLRFQMDIPDSNLRKFVFLFMTIAFLSCYFAGLSFDYRLVFLAIGCLAFLSIAPDTGKGTTFMWILLLVALWGSCSLGVLLKPEESIVWTLLFGGFQFIGDLAIMIWVPILIVNVLVIVLGPGLQRNVFGNKSLDILLGRFKFSPVRVN
jgi:hypothetical protein